MVEIDLTAPIIGAYGFFMPHKGFGLLIEAFSELLKDWPAASLRLVTAEYPNAVSKDEILRCRRLSKDLGVAHAIEWHTAFLPNSEFYLPAICMRHCCSSL